MMSIAFIVKDLSHPKWAVGMNIILCILGEYFNHQDMILKLSRVKFRLNYFVDIAVDRRDWMNVWLYNLEA